MTAGRFEWPQPIENLDASLQAVDSMMHGLVGKGRLGRAASSLINSGGKRLRPALTLKSASLSGKKPGQKTIAAAAAIELVHLASLVHDDLMDGSPQRRQQAAAAAAYGQKFGLLLGDYLLAGGLSAATAADLKIVRLLADTIAGMAEGEAIEQGAAAASAEPLSTTYFRLISQKTAGLFASAAAAGAICGGLPEKSIKSLTLYGNEFGMAFQLVDDVHDHGIRRSQKAAAIQEINNRIKAAESHLANLNGDSIESLKALPAAYLAWASPL